jgi:hypothetical protein
LDRRRTSRLGRLTLESIDDGSDRDLIASLEADLLDDPPVYANPVPTAQISEDNPIVRNRQAAMTPGDLAILDPGIAVGVPADEDDGPLQRDDRGRPWVHGDELE